MKSMCVERTLSFLLPPQTADTLPLSKRKRRIELLPLSAKNATLHS